MKEYRKVAKSIWGSRKFLSLPDDKSRLLYLYLLTNRNSNSLGCYEVDERYTCFDLNLSEIEYGYGMDTLSKAGLIQFCPETSLVLICGYTKVEEPQNAKHMLGLLRQVSGVPDHPIKLAFTKELVLTRFGADCLKLHQEIERLEGLFGQISDTVSIPYRYKDTDTDKDTDKDKDSDTDTDKDNNSFVPISENPDQLDLIPEEDSGDLVSHCVEIFNEFAKQTGWAKVQRITDKRRTAMKRRLDDLGGVEQWRHAVKLASMCDWLIGNSKSGWMLDFDWLTKAANLTKVVEGSYKNNSAASRQQMLLTGIINRMEG